MTYIESVRGLLSQIQQPDIDRISSRLKWATGVYVLGNGGSQANAGHLALHLNEVGISTTDLMAETSMMSALSNDYSYQQAPMLRLRRQAKPSDVLVVITGSGDSVNILAALAEAKRIGMATIGLLGFGGGAAKGLCELSCVLSCRDYGPIEDVHSAIVHMIFQECKTQH